MKTIRITIQAMEDIGKVGPAITDPSTIKPLDITDICFMENGTKGGKISVFIVLKDPAGVEYKTEITEGNFKLITGVFMGAVGRFEDLRKARAQKN